MNYCPALLAAAALAAAVGVYLALGCLGGGGIEELPALARALQHGEELDRQRRAGPSRVEARRTLAAEVAAGRLSLHEAARHFRRLEKTDPAYPPGIPRPAGDERGLHEWVVDVVGEVLAQDDQFAAAARWYAEVFTAHPQLLAGPPTGHRYQAASAAARAGCGKGRDATGLDEQSRARFRRQALGWLRAALEARQRLLERGPQAARNTITRDLEHWLEVPHFAKVRGPDALGRLPVGERQAWQQLWADVADTLARAEGTPPEPKAGSKVRLPER
jgi:hypothetical protein